MSFYKAQLDNFKLENLSTKQQRKYYGQTKKIFIYLF